LNHHGRTHPINQVGLIYKSTFQGRNRCAKSWRLLLWEAWPWAQPRWRIAPTRCQEPRAPASLRPLTKVPSLRKFTVFRAGPITPRHHGAARTAVRAALWSRRPSSWRRRWWCDRQSWSSLLAPGAMTVGAAGGGAADLAALDDRSSGPDRASGRPFRFGTATRSALLCRR
jgi:hypothetical protein